jgi:hypothetical protein
MRSDEPELELEPVRPVVAAVDDLALAA